MGNPTNQPFTLKNEEMILLHEKAMYWEKHKILLISDVHIGKVSHFRKNGIQVPMQSCTADIECLENLLFDIQPDKLLILGDLFHSDPNSEFTEFTNMLDGFNNLETILVKGNHDRWTHKINPKNKIQILDFLKIAPFLFTHEPIELDKNSNHEYKDFYRISGHIHPSVTLRGKANQSLTLSCFYFGKEQALLPAFGNFTGNCPVQPQSGDKVFVIAGDKVIKWEV